jgi:hypothetical protein
MRENPASSPEQEGRDRVLLTLTGIALSVAALVYYQRQNAILLYGDAVAHINIARRVFDSRTPSIFQLGTVWLPLPHLLDIPFVMSDTLWRTGVGPSFPSMLAYIAATIGIFRMVRGFASRGSAWIAVLIFALNPNLLYMQATAMTESLYLALFIWTVVFFSEFVLAAPIEEQRARKSLERCAIALSAAMLVRYDAWFLAAIVVGSVLVFIGRRTIHQRIPKDHSLRGAYAAGILVGWRSRISRVYGRAVLALFVLPTLTGALWLAYNFGMYRNPLEFATGPYSARAIQQRSKTASMPTYPGESSPRDATLYFLKLARLNMSEGRFEQLLFAAALVSLLAVIYFSRRFLPLLLLWVPLPFYVLSIAWGSVPIFFPEWWPHSYYNVRYGLQLLPAMAVFIAVGCEMLKSFFSMRRVATAAILAIAFSYIPVWQATPICLREAEANGKARMQFDQELAGALQELPRSATLLMEASVHPGALQQAGIPFGRVICESNYPEWTIALSQPAESADYVIAFPKDEVARAVRFFPGKLRTVAILGTPGGPRAVIYRSLAR